ncbi:MAG: hypothetical protein ACJ763_05165 [Bdellovibrionia bacterium]
MNAGQTQLGKVLGIVAFTVTAFIVMVHSLGAWAKPCEGVPHCETQEMDAVSYKAWQTKGWAYYCTGDHPYYWNNAPALGFGNNFSFDNKCFSVTENPPAEDQPSKMDATITNWCFKKEKIKMTLGCSQQPQDGPTCSGPTKVISDPGCAIQGTPHNSCSGGTVPVCVQTWTESCSSGPVYCTKDSVFPTWCIACK